nr:MAG TPA: hypothetical protein [Caudoviricetes sp.]
MIISHGGGRKKSPGRPVSSRPKGRLLVSARPPPACGDVGMGWRHRQPEVERRRTRRRGTIDAI